MPKKKPVTTKRGQHHKFKSFWINLVKDATLEKIDSNILRNNPDTFEKKKVTFEKKNSDPSHFQQTLCGAFPSLEGKEFSLWRLACTNASKEMKTSLIPLPAEIDNAVALCNCDELNRSCLYIKLQATPASQCLPSQQPPFVPSDDEDDSRGSVSSSTPNSPSKMSRISDLLFPNSDLSGSSPVFSLNPTWPTVASSSDVSLVPLNTTAPSNQQPFTAQLYIFKDKQSQRLYLTSKAEVPSGRDTENRLPKKRKFPPDNEKNCGPTVYADANGSAGDNMDGMSLGLLPNAERAAFTTVDSQQLTAPLSYTSYTAFLGNDTLTSEMAEQGRNLDINFSHQMTSYPTFHPNTPVFVELQNNASEATNFQGTSGRSNSFGQPLIASSMSSLMNYASGASGLQSNAQLWSDDVNSTSVNHVQTTNSLGAEICEVIGAGREYMTQEERQIGLLRRHMDFLVDRIDPDFGLLDVLLARKDLTMAEFHQIRLMPSTVEERNQKLLNYVIEKNKADKLIAALVEARQTHLANYLKSDGECEAANRNVWPMSEKELGKLISNRQALIDGLDATYLSFKLFFKDVINKRQHEFILSKPTNSEKNEAMLEILRHGSVEHYKQTIESLRELDKDRWSILNVLEEVGEDEFVCSSTADLRYKSDPVLVQTIRTKASEERKRDIWGLTILDKELFAVSGWNSEVEVYDSVKLSFIRRLKLKELIRPMDLGSCNRTKCLYIIDYKGDRKFSEILRVDPYGNLITSWSIGRKKGYDMSVTYESNVLLTGHEIEKIIIEYSPDGLLIREINLSPDFDICTPRHAVKLTNGHFLVTHGTYGDDLHRVCLLDGDGKLKKSFGGKQGSSIGQMNCPEYLDVDGNGFVMVADRLNSRVLLLDSDLEFKREILSKEKHGLRCPDRILLDQTNNRLLVADNELRYENKRLGGRISVFSLDN